MLSGLKKAVDFAQSRISAEHTAVFHKKMRRAVPGKTHGVPHGFRLIRGQALRLDGPGEIGASTQEAEHQIVRPCGLRIIKSIANRVRKFMVVKAGKRNHGMVAPQMIVIHHITVRRRGGTLVKRRQAGVFGIAGLTQEDMLDMAQPPRGRPPAVADKKIRIHAPDRIHDPVHRIDRTFTDMILRRVFLLELR